MRKTCEGTRADWMLNKKAEEKILVAAIVCPHCRSQLAARETYIVAPILSLEGSSLSTIRDSHREWLATPGRGGRQHVDNDMRRFKDPTGRYRDRWDLLGLDGEIV
jgi:hypothetical protein